MITYCLSRLIAEPGFLYLPAHSLGTTRNTDRRAEFRPAAGKGLPGWEDETPLRAGKGNGTEVSRGKRDTRQCNSSATACSKGQEPLGSSGTSGKPPLPPTGTGAASAPGGAHSDSKAAGLPSRALPLPPYRDHPGVARANR